MSKQTVSSAAKSARRRTREKVGQARLTYGDKPRHSNQAKPNTITNSVTNKSPAPLPSARRSWSSLSLCPELLLSLLLHLPPPVSQESLHLTTAESLLAHSCTVLSNVSSRPHHNNIERMNERGKEEEPGKQRQL